MLGSVTCRSVPLREEAADAAARATDALAGMFRQLHSADWTVTREGQSARVVVKVKARSGSYTATATGPSLEASFQDVVARIKVQRRRRKLARLRARGAARR